MLDIYKILKENNILYPAKVSVKGKAMIKTFSKTLEFIKFVLHT